jgi:hypothetical protein
LQHQLISHQDEQPDGLFSHPDTDHLRTSSGVPAQEQRSYTGLFREPAFAPETTTSAA